MLGEEQREGDQGEALGWVGEDDQLVARFESEGRASLGGDRDLSSSAHGDGAEEAAPSGTILLSVIPI